MKAYIGTKVIKAEPMTRGEWEHVYPEGQSIFNQPGYHVVYPNPDGTEYHSWSPKEQFERAYREVYPDETEFLRKGDA